MDNLSYLIDEKIKYFKGELTFIRKKVDLFVKELAFWERVGKLHEEQPLWNFLRDIKDITTSLNKSLEEEK